MALFESMTSWLSSMFGQALAKVTSVIDEALGIAKLEIPDLEIPTFVDMFRSTIRDAQFRAMIENPNVPQLAKDTEFIEADYTMKRNYLARFFVQYVDETTGEVTEGLRSMYVDQRLSNDTLIDMFLALDRGPEYQPKGMINFISFEDIKHSKGSPYGPL
jgi:hypothetical protein